MEADKIFINGEIITADEQFHVYEALAVQEESILQTGTNDEVMKAAGADTEVVDLEGRTLMPGFIDAHAHLELYGTNILGVDCKQPRSIPEVLKALKKRAVETPEGCWVRGWGYNQNELAEGRHLTRWDLDKVSTSHPVIVVRTCGHISCVNSKALEMAGIVASTPDPPGGAYHKINGQLSGLLLEAAHMTVFQHADYSEEDIMKGLALASQDFLSYGITSVHDAGGYGTKHIRYLQQAVHKGIVMQRVYALYGSLSDAPEMVRAGLESGISTGLGDDWFRIGPAKLFIDGSSSGPTCRTREPYDSSPEDRGILYLRQHQLDEPLLQAHEHGWQITAHAMGDEAVDMMLHTIERALDQKSAANSRHRIEHAGITPPDLVERMRQTGAVPVPNPAFLYEFGDGYETDYGGRVSHMFPLKSYSDHHIPYAVGSDSPITTPNPFYGLYAAVTRRSKSGRILGENQASSLEEVIRAYTWGGAYASHEEHRKGTLEPGKAADLIILDRSIMNCPVSELPGIQVETTILNGKTVYTLQKEDVY
ncbi:amidohydrolase family protein [Halobacillus halophilus]|uniref:amidohydrolase n=1 Tax=Halobacillus halophilus TaxID=1570 RepID=UPI00136A5970|nr:amidohydrolase [Halobacillus halophilus]MYL30435.1 amidohydrolase family protein [Halobacillus halophilus]